MRHSQIQYGTKRAGGMENKGYDKDVANIKQMLNKH